MEPLVFVLGLLGAIAIHVLASEMYARTSGIALALIRKAARRLNEPMRRRYEEEWYAHLDQCPGNLSKLAHAIGCSICAWKLGQIPCTQKVPVAADVVPFRVEEKTIHLDVSTLAYVLKRMRFVLKDRNDPQAIAPLNEHIKALEGEFILGDPDCAKLKEVAAALEVTLRKLRSKTSNEDVTR